MVNALIICGKNNESSFLIKHINSHYPAIRIMDVIGSMEYGIKSIKSNMPELVFAEFPENSEDLNRLIYATQDAGDIVFLLSNAEHIKHIIKLGGFPFLMFPLEFEDLDETLKTVVRKVKRRKELSVIINSVNVNRLKQTESMLISTTKSLIHVWLKELIRLEADGNYTYIYIKDNRKIHTSKNLKKYEEELIPHDFFRVNKSFIINLHYLRFMHKGQKSTIELSDGFITEISSKVKNDLKEKLDKITSFQF